MKHIKKFSTEFSPLLEHIHGYGIIENYENGYVLIAYNFFEQDYKLKTDSIYITTVEQPITEKPVSKHTLSFIHHEDNSFFQKELAINCGFYSTELINNGENHRICFFKSHNNIIYDNLINNTALTKDFIVLFKNNNQDILEYFANIRSDFDKQKDTYFREPNNFSCLSEKEQMLAIFKAMNILNKNSDLTQDEWRLLDVYNYGKSHNVKVDHILNISEKEIANNLKKIKYKILNKQSIF